MFFLRADCGTPAIFPRDWRLNTMPTSDTPCSPQLGRHPIVTVCTDGENQWSRSFYSLYYWSLYVKNMSNFHLLFTVLKNLTLLPTT